MSIKKISVKSMLITKTLLVWSVLLVCFGIFTSTPCIAEKPKQKIEPALSSEFGKIISVTATLHLHMNSKGVQNIDSVYMVTQKVESKFQNSTITCIGFDKQTDKFLKRYAHEDIIFTIVGYESLSASGLPGNIQNYVSSIPAAPNYAIKHEFVVLKIEE